MHLTVLLSWKWFLNLVYAFTSCSLLDAHTISPPVKSTSPYTTLQMWANDLDGNEKNYILISPLMFCERGYSDFIEYELCQVLLYTSTKSILHIDVWIKRNCILREETKQFNDLDLPCTQKLLFSIYTNGEFIPSYSFHQTFGIKILTLYIWLESEESCHSLLATILNH